MCVSMRSDRMSRLEHRPNESRMLERSRPGQKKRDVKVLFPQRVEQGPRGSRRPVIDSDCNGLV